MRTRTTLVAALLGCLLVAGCGQSDEDAPDAEPTGSEPSDSDQDSDEDSDDDMEDFDDDEGAGGFGCA